MKNILIVSSFMADTYSNIENIYINMSKDLQDSYNFIWLVRDTKSKNERYKNPDLKGRLEKALFVEELEKNNIQYVTADIDKYNVFSNYILFKKLFKKYSIDAVYTHFNFEKYWTAFFAKLFSKKVFYNEHMYFEADKSSWKKKTLKKSRTAFINSFSDRIIAVSGFIANDFSPEKTTVLYNAIDINEVAKSPELKKNNIDQKNNIQMIYPDQSQIKRESRKKLGLDSDAHFVIMTAAFRPVKDHYAAVDIVKRVMQKRPDIRFIFAGDGELLDTIKNLSAKIGIEENIIFTGHTNNIQDYYKASDIAMLTSKVEPFGYTVIEAMINMLPVVAFSSIGGPDEIITDEQDGFLIKNRDTRQFSDMIIKLIDDEEMRKEIGSNARGTVIEKFGYNRWIKDIRKIFDYEFYEGGVR